jgi:hypothetical protein
MNIIVCTNLGTTRLSEEDSRALAEAAKFVLPGLYYAVGGETNIKLVLSAVAKAEPEKAPPTRLAWVAVQDEGYRLNWLPACLPIARAHLLAEELP